MRAEIFTSFALIATLACAGDKIEAATSAPPQEVQAQAEPGQTGSEPSLTGILDEDSFAALHELNTKGTPPLHGETIALAGTQAYLSLPAGANAPLPAVVIIHEWWGLNDHIRHWSDRLAEDGYAALAIDLYDGQVATEPDGAMTLMKGVDAAKSEAILSAAHDYLASDPRVLADKQGVIGWCFGGGWSLRDAISRSDLDAAVIYYGNPVIDAEQLAGINAELLGVFANQDQAITPARVDEFTAGLEDAGKSIELHRYDAHHGFANPSSAKYDHAAASEAWAHVRVFLARQLRGE